MKLFIVARNKKVINPYKKVILQNGFEFGNVNPEIVISLGGDGTYLISENLFPGIAKLLIRNTDICNKVSIKLFESILNTLKDKTNYKIEEYLKLECVYKKNALIAANDIILRNKDQRTAIRFRLKVNSIPIKDEFIGDGVVISTPWGSTGYYHSITKKQFKKGLGIALNNINRDMTDILVKENSKIEIIITRGDAILSADNARKEFTLKTGDTFLVKRYKNTGKKVILKNK